MTNPSSFPSGRRQLFSALISRLQTEQVSYCVLAGETDQEMDNASDLDLVVSPEDFTRIPRLLAAVAEECGGQLVQAIPHETTATHFMLAMQANGKVSFLDPDICSDYRRQQRLWMRSKELLEGRRLSEGSSVPAYTNEFRYYLTKKILKQTITCEQLRRLHALYTSDKAGCREQLERRWLPPMVRALEPAIVQQDIGWFRRHCESLLRQLQSSSRHETLAGQISQYTRNLARIFRRLLRPTGLCILIAGTGGEQWTALAEDVISALAPAFRRTQAIRLEWRGWIRTLLPILSAVYRGKICSTLTVIAAEDRPLSAAVRCLLGADLAFGYSSDGTIPCDTAISPDCPHQARAAAITSSVLDYLAWRMRKRYRPGAQRPRVESGADGQESPVANAAISLCQVPVMRVLLSAYACEPGRGSEPAVGWNWATELANQGKEVWILTRAAHREIIERALPPDHNRMHFLYYDLPPWLRLYRRGSIGKALYYLLWQWFSVSFVLNLRPMPAFNTAQHVTYVSIRFPSFLWRLGIPFCIGPISGGERMPAKLRSQMTLAEQLREWLRDLWNLSLRHDPLIGQSLRRADRIIVTPDTLRLIPRRWQYKCRMQLAIGLTSHVQRVLPLERSGKAIRLLYAGRLLGWKGVDIAIAALHELRRTGCDARLTIAGEGPAFRRLQALAVRMTVSPWIEWRGKVPESEMEVYYNAADVLLFPSLRDSGGMVVLEALSHGLPVVCADLGGPRRIVTPECGRIVVTQQRQRSQLGIAFADAVRDIMSRPELRQSLADGACRRAMDFQFRDLVRSLYPAAETPAIGATA